MMEPDLSTDLATLAEPARQAPVAIVSDLVKRIRGLGPVNLAVAVGAIVSGRIPVWILAVVPVVSLALLVWLVALWWRFTFRATEDSLIVTRGVIGRTELTIPFAKVQSVTVDEGVFDRLFGLVSASIDTAGNERAEFSINGIARNQAEGLRRLASQRRESAKPTAVGAEFTGLDSDDEPQVLLRRSPTELAVLGLLTNPLGGLAVLGTLALFADDILGAFGIELASLADGLAAPSRRSFLVVLAVIVVLAAVGTSLRTVVSDWNLRLTSDQDGLALNAGLIRRRSRSSLINKIQSVGVRRGPLIGRLGFARLQLSTIGGGDLNLIGVTEDELARIRSLVQTPFAANPPSRISPHFVWHRLRLAGVAAVLGAIANALVDRRFADWRFLALWLVLPVLVGLKSYFFQRRFRWQLERETISIRRGRLFENETGMNLKKIQSVTVTQSFYQRNRSLASVTISNAESAVGLPMLSLAESNLLRDRLLHLLESDSQPTIV